MKMILILEALGDVTYIGTSVSRLVLTALHMSYTAIHPRRPKHKPPAGVVNTVINICCFPADDKETF